MLLSKLKTHVFALSVCVTFLSSCTSFDWEPRPYVGDSPNSQLINEQGETVKCDQPIFDTYTCFDAENMAELVSAIDQIDDKSVREKAQKALKSLRIP